MSNSTSQIDQEVGKPTDGEVQAMFNELVPRSKVKEWVKASGKRMYWRLLNPFVMVWCFMYQRLSKDHTQDEVVNHLLSGDADNLESQGEDQPPLSEQLESESTSAYAQGRKRMPLSVLKKALYHVYETILSWLHEDQRQWKGHNVRRLDGTTFRLRPFGDLAKTYGQAENQHGKCYWVIVRVVAAFCLYSESLVACADGPIRSSESSLVRKVMEQDPDPNSIYIADGGFGFYRPVQVADALNHPVVLRVSSQTATWLWKSNSCEKPFKSGFDQEVTWKPNDNVKAEPDLARKAVSGRLIYIRLERKGFRPFDLYLFTTLLDAEVYSFEEIVELFGQRWYVEVDLRDVKATLQMGQLEVKSAEMFRKELIAGFLTYNVIRAYMVKAAIHAGIEVRKLSFSKCWRRVRTLLTRGLPAWVIKRGDGLVHFLKRLAKCKLPKQPKKAKHEPRKVRHKPESFPPLRGSREQARKELLQASDAT